MTEAIRYVTSRWRPSPCWKITLSAVPSILRTRSTGFFLILPEWNRSARWKGNSTELRGNEAPLIPKSSSSLFQRDFCGFRKWIACLYGEHEYYSWYVDEVVC